MSEEQMQSHATSIFEEPWWLDAVAPQGWAEAVVEADGQTMARLPYVRKRRAGLRIIGLAPLSQHAGPYVAITADKGAKQISQEVRLFEALIDQLPPADVVQLSLSPEHQNWLPFHWNGFEQTTRYTYRLSLDDEEKLWQQMRSNIRRDIRKAEKQVEVREDAELDDFLPLQRQTFDRQDTSFPYSEDIVRRLDAACLRKGRRRIFVAEDREGRPHAGVYLVWGQGVAHYLLGGNDPALRNSGAMSLAMWHAIRCAREHATVFDFEGSMLRPVERYFRAFGATQTPYLRVRRLAPRARRILALRSMLTGKPPTN